MAYKVGNTTVINDSRQLQNITSLDSTTSNTVSAASSPPTSHGAVGTYTFGYIASPIAATTTIAAGTTVSGSSIKIVLPQNSASGNMYSTIAFFISASSNSQPSNYGLSGTWRHMAPVRRSSSQSYGTYYYTGFFVRIS